MGGAKKRYKKGIRRWKHDKSFEFKRAKITGADPVDKFIMQKTFEPYYYTLDYKEALPKNWVV